ncbi:MAG: branched-chain amino acid ABC transporter permease [Erysipelotrichaceae bacterium]|nr:branched-chain amino acid ABC transporter permease [Erysipelotrichaceae bacterium]MBO4538341.1 branched-chain amino acid ABC transporter permease [Erysipelotrichaceae bacterium]MBR5049605.1 branched-chain amino acid ABC transporter permease [Erysipelotrichaceae bacterium]
MISRKFFAAGKLNRTVSYLLVIVGYIVLQTLLNAGALTSHFSSLLVPLTSYIVIAIALNLTVGFSGELSLGHAGFMGVGAFSAVIISGLLLPYVPNTALRLVIAMLGAALVSSLFGALIGIPVLKLEGDYLAIVTLAFNQIIKTIINSLYLGYDNQGIQFSFVNNNVSLGEGAVTILKGPIGANGIKRISTFTAGFVLILITLLVVYNLINSRKGRAIMACRDNRIAAESVGINVMRVKLEAFVISAALAGAAGALYGLNYSTLTPAKFDYNLSIMILVYVVLGGLGNITGTIIATALLYILPEQLRFLQDYRMIIYAVVLIGIMLITNNDWFRYQLARFSRKLKRRRKQLKGGAAND